MAAPEKIIELCERFDRNRDTYKQSQYHETQVRREFIDPFFKALGWDIDNEKGNAEAYKDVVHEDAIKVGGATKAPDYSFRIGGVRKFFLEAKKPSVYIKEDIHPAYQLRRYAWSAKLPLSILTDFEEFAVYDCRLKPEKLDKPSVARVLYLTYPDYPGRWDELAQIFSPEAIYKGAFDQYAASNLTKKGTTTVDAAFLQEIERWRDALAKNIALRNPQLAQSELNFAVQRTIDRIIFLRISEDRGLEPYGALMALQNGTQVYPRLFQLFYRADERYNSGLFHFESEKTRASLSLDTLTPHLNIDDKVLKDIFKNLYYPDSPYEFYVLPADILGQVYEQFLGKVIRLTAGHRAVVETKPEVRKAGGVYYTPTYIVDYIVKQTVGKLLVGKTPGQKGSASQLRILDPACGSGSFLLGGYQFLLNWYRDAYQPDHPERWAQAKQPPIRQNARGEWVLTTDERKRILLTHIYGVDLDPQAVEVTKLSLLLKVLEGEDAQTIDQQMKFFHERALPDLNQNIKCGNSLIGPDFYDGQQLGLLDQEELQRINALDWKQEFAAVFENGGFDAVIGNPPYVRQESLGEFKTYFQQKYQVFHGMADLYVYFIERGFSLLKAGGIFSYIVANKWLRANYGTPLRNWLKQQCLHEIIDFGDLPVFQAATTYPCIINLAKEKANEIFEAAKVDSLKFTNLDEYVQPLRYPVTQAKLDEQGWSLASSNVQAVLEKLFQKGVPLAQYVDHKIFRGILTGLNEAFVISPEIRDKLINEDMKNQELIKPFLAGREIKRYENLTPANYLILMPKGWTREKSKNAANPWNWFKMNYPALARHLEPFREQAQKRSDQGEFWWELRACDYYNEFDNEKIIYPNICSQPEFTYDESGFYTNQKCFII
ncbi:Eco57I restriction-modification methylase domain-containing protein, partial [candidate division KSB1 bacterium]|nr:Eco57I restriction-modification methylase domain-containing protein [candidate division KSB1 bacterium]